MNVEDIDLNKLSLRDVQNIVKNRTENESEVIEIKESIVKPAIISDYIAQFANNRGGLLIFGFKDDGTKSNKITNFSKENENSIIEGDLCTYPSVGIQVKSLEDSRNSSWVIVMKVPKPTDGIPRISSKGASVKRVGSRRSIIPPLERAYEREIIWAASINDLDSSLMELFVSKLKSKLANLPGNTIEIFELFQLVRKDERGELRPTVAGMILFGKSPEVFISGTRINIIRYATSERTNEILESEVITGPILSSMEETHNKTWSLIRKNTYLISGKRHEISEYPYIVIREAIYNAFFHNDYQIHGDIFIELFPDRLEIKNMGIPLGGTRLSDLMSKPKYRNRILLKVLSEMGFVEGWGVGIKMMVENLKKNGLPEPILNVENEETRLCFRTHTFLGKDTLDWINKLTSRYPISINFRQVLALAYTKHKKKITNSIYQNVNGVSTHVAGNELRELSSYGLLVQLGRGKSSYYTLVELFDKDEIRLEKYYPMDLLIKLRNPQRRILSIVETFGEINSKQILYQSGYTDLRGVQRLLNSLVKLGLLNRIGKSMSDPNAYYEINKEYSKKIKKLPKQLRLEI